VGKYSFFNLGARWGGLSTARPSRFIARAERDGTRAETRFRLSPKRTSTFKSVGASVQSTAGSRGVHISFSNAGYITFGCGVRVLATHSIRQFPLPCVSVCRQVPNELYLRETVPVPIVQETGWTSWPVSTVAKKSDPSQRQSIPGPSCL